MDELNFFKQRVELTMPVRKFFRDRKSDPDKMLLIDVRNATPGDMGSIISGAIHIPESEIRNRLSELPKDKTIIVYTWDDWCNLAAHAAIVLLENGFRVMELRGGIAACYTLNLPTEKL